MKTKLSAYWIYLIYVGVSAFLFELVFTVNEIYRIEVVGFNAMQLVIVGTAVELSCFLFEIPTGILADIKSRKLSVVIGVILIGIGFLIEGLIPNFVVIFICQIIWGIGVTFTSGANEAWIADELGGNGNDKNHFINMINYIKNNDIREDKVYQYIKTQMDVENFIDYNIIQIFIANGDWPFNNVKYWRKRTENIEDSSLYGHDGKWRWLLFDTDSFNSGKIS